MALYRTSSDGPVSDHPWANRALTVLAQQTLLQKCVAPDTLPGCLADTVDRADIGKIYFKKAWGLFYLLNEA